MGHEKSSDVSSLADLKDPSAIKASKRSLREKILSFVLDGPPGTASSRNERELRQRWDEDKLDIPRTPQEEKERQERMKRRREIIGGGDGLRTNDMQKGDGVVRIWELGMLDLDLAFLLVIYVFWFAL